MAGGGNVDAPAAPAPAGEAVETMRIPIPMFSEENFCMYMDEIKVWKEVCGLPKDKQGMVLWIHLPRDKPSDIKESINASVGVIEPKKETGVDKFVA